MSAPDQSITANVSNDPKLERCTTFDGYTDEQWQSIKSIVRSIVDNLDIDDAVRVGKPAKPLRQALEELADWHISRSILARLRRTPKQRISDIDEAVAAIEGVIPHVRIVTSRTAMSAPRPGRLRVAERALREFCDELLRRKRDIDVDASRSARNASKPHRHAYLVEVEKIWQKLVGQRQVQRKLKEAFLLECAEPTFGANEWVIKKFLDDAAREKQFPASPR